MPRLMNGVDQVGSARFFYGWYIVAASFLTLMFAVGIPFYGIPFFYDHFSTEFGWTRGQLTSGIALGTVLVQPAGGLLIHRFSPRRLIIFGSVALSLSMICFGLGTGSLWFYYLAWVLFMVGYLCAGPLPNQVILSQWFSRRRGLAIGIAYLGLGVGGALSQKFIILPLIARFGWRDALFAIAGMLVVVPAAMIFVRNRPGELGLHPDGDPAPPPEAEPCSASLRELLRHPGFWLLALGSCATIGSIGSVNQHMKLIFLEASLEAATVAETTFVILVWSLVGRVLLGWMADHFGPKWVMLFACLLVALPVPLLFVIAEPGASTIFAIVFGLGLGPFYLLIPLVAAKFFGVQSLARVMGVILPLDSLGQTGFPLVLGVLRDQSGAYTSGLMLVFGLGLAGAAAIALLPAKTGTPCPADRRERLCAT